ncbi:MAG: ABC transporter ATP-binding protein [Kiloniellales bacterium]|nr:ABC transporter ATP-binding protein [Kiloniellales bacterium]
MPKKKDDRTVILSLDRVTRKLIGPPPVTLVEDVSLSVSPGDFIAITGPSGSGKSSLLYLMGLLDRPDEGEVKLQGQATRALSERERAKLRLSTLGYVFQFHFLLPEFTVEENVLLPMRRLARAEEEEMFDKAAKLLKQLGIEDCRRKKPGQLSGGESQRAAIARALANDPLMVLADEPTGNLDTKNSRIVFETFTELVADAGRAVVAVTHDPEMAALCSRRLRIVDGRLA